MVEEAWSYDWIVIVGFFIAFLLAISVGANDVANPFGTSVGSGALTLLQCFVLATLMETLGAMTMGGAVSDTIRKKIVNIEEFDAANTTEVTDFMIGQLAAMFGAATWQIIASIVKMPVSGTHSIVGAVVGFALISKGPNAIQWMTIAKIVASWVISPLLSGIMAITLYKLVSVLILKADKPVARAFVFLPIFYSFVVAFNTFSILHTMNKIYEWSGGCETEIGNYSMIAENSTLTAEKGVCFQPWHFGLMGLGTGIFVYFAVYFFLLPHLQVKLDRLKDPKAHLRDANVSWVSIVEKKLGLEMDDDSDDDDSQVDIVKSGFENKQKGEKMQFINDEKKVADLEMTDKDGTTAVVEKAPTKDGSESSEMKICFKNLQAFSACFDAFAHGGNDVGNSIGPVLALYSVAETCKPLMSMCNINQSEPPKSWIIAIGCAGIVLGLWALGKRVIKTVGKGIARITPARGFAIDIMAGFTVLFGSMCQIPLSTTHCKVGAVVAVSLIHDPSSVSIRTFRSIALAWFVTLPVSGGISALAYLGLKQFV